ncbi:MAG: leucine-rich repeat protein [Bacteroidaceae bacterium]|nr:leucine-rich repeat protein [Bacteroidaceae bacterium]
MKKFLTFLTICSLAGHFSSCNDGVIENVRHGSMPISLSAQLQQQNVTRANEQGFVTGDRMGVYIVDYEGTQPGALDATANRASNVLYTFDGENYKWTAPTQLYWRDGSTPVDVYGYYPGINYIDEPTAYEFEVSELQNIVPEDGGMSNYEVSDFLWGKTAKVSPTEQTITVKYNHRMAGVWVYLKAGEGITTTEWEKLDKVVLVENTVRTATIDLTDGVPVASGQVDKSIVMLPQSGDSYRAVVVPQKVAAGKKLISVTLDGITYTHSLTSEMDYQMGKIHNFTITINKVEATGDYELKVSYDGITDWVNDETSHAFSSTAYVVIHCPEMGTLKQCIIDAGYDYTTMQNLKVTGEITDDDFVFINKEMSGLKHLNLKDVKVKNVETVVQEWSNGQQRPVARHYDDMLPDRTFYQNKNIRSMILPSSLKRVGGDAFRESRLMYSTLEIPEGVTYIGGAAFAYNEYNGMTLKLPNSLDSIEGGVLTKCPWDCEFNIPENLKYIGGTWYPSAGSPRLKGTFRVPSNLRVIPEGAFCGMGSDGSFTGEIEIPQGVTEIGEAAFSGLAIKNRINLTLPQGVKKIGHIAFHGLKMSSLKLNDDLERVDQWAFLDTSMPFQIELPQDLIYIGPEAFCGCGIEGEIVIPEGCVSIGRGAFRGNQITKLTIPSRLEMIEDETFQSVGRITEITIPKFVDYIGDRAIAGNAYLQTVVCLNPEPPVLKGNPFEGLYMDKVVLQVPEQSVELYRSTEGWNQFNNITAYRELAFNVSDIVAMDKGAVRSGILRSEGAWEVVECPSWVTVSPSSSEDKKTEVTVTMHEQSEGSVTREGKIVFRLKDKDYTTYTTVKQVAADVAEDETVVLQEASAGAPKAIPLFIVGEGYNAEDIASGKYMTDMRAQMEHFFSIEPMKTYRDYFTVSTAVACSPQSGIYEMTKFESNNDRVLEYAKTYGAGIEGNESNATILVLRNTNMLNNSTELYRNGLSISWMGISSETYPFSQQGYILRELAGKSFGKLADESVNHMTFLKACVCPGCNVSHLYNEYRPLGWWQNVSVSGKMNELPWYHYIFDEKYSKYVDVYEGGMNHSRGVYRSEPMSVMGNTYVPYFNTISREILVRRIMACAGLPFSMEEFLAKDKIELPEELVDNY